MSKVTVSQTAISAAADTLRGLAQKQKDKESTIADAIRALRADITQARRAGVGWADIAASLAEVGIKASPKYVSILASAKPRIRKDKAKNKSKTQSSTILHKTQTQPTTPPTQPGMHTIRPDTVDL